MKNQGIKIFSLGCRLNALETEKIRAMLAAGGMTAATVINTCSVTNEAGRQSGQLFRKILRENPGPPIFITGCEATLNPEKFAAPNAVIIANKDKFNPAAYGLPRGPSPAIAKFEKMRKKGFVQISDGCDRHCTYCIARILRGPMTCRSEDDIIADARALSENGYEEIILTGVNIADYSIHNAQHAVRNLAGLCGIILSESPGIRLALSSLDPAADVESIIDFIRAEPRMTPHLHLSAQSGCDEILQRMARRHNAARMRDIHKLAGDAAVSISWDIICGFPGETDDLFEQTLALAHELKPIKIHAFPFSARPGTPAASMPDQIPRTVAKRRVGELIKKSRAF